MVLPAYQSLPFTIPLILLSLLLSPLPPYIISQPNYPAIIRQLQEQIAILTAQIGEATGRGEGASVVTEVANHKLLMRHCQRFPDS